MKGSRLVPNEESFFMGRLIVESAMCRDPEVQKMAMIVSSSGDVLSHGYNSIVKDYTNTATWADRDFALYQAEEQAIDRALRRFSPSDNTPLTTCTMYITNPPVHSALVRGVGLGLKKYIYVVMNERTIDAQDLARCQKICRERKIEVKVFDGNLNWLRDRIKKFDYLF